MNAEEIRRRAAERLRERRSAEAVSVAMPEWSEPGEPPVLLHFHYPATLSELQSAVSKLRGAADGGVSQEAMDDVLNTLVFTLAKDEHGERVWTDFDEFDRSLTYAQLVRIVNESGCFESLVAQMGSENGSAEA